tara:strand:+ start:172742 stop:173761 length:1020 start_codon:yes stop_codon:yes gene_type:complete
MLARRILAAKTRILAAKTLYGLAASVRLATPLLGVTAMMIVALPSQSHADMVNVLVIDRDFDTNGFSGFSASGRYANAFSDLTDPSNFGTGGIQDYSLNFSTVSTLTNSDLASAGLVIFAHTDGLSPSSGPGGEVETLTNYVNSGGSLLTIGHGMSYDWRGSISPGPPLSLSDTLAQRSPREHHNSTLGTASEYRFPVNGFMNENPATAADVINSGPFGGVGTVKSNQNAYWDGSSGMSTGTFALQYSTGGAFTPRDGLFGTFGMGRYMMIGSVDAVASSYTDPSNNNKEFLLNSFAYLGETAPRATAVPEPSSLFLTAIAGIPIALRRRRRASSTLAR